MKTTNAPELKTPAATSMLGLATVRESHDKSWLRWACVYPSQPTKWFKTGQAARDAANLFNGTNL